MLTHAEERCSKEVSKVKARQVVYFMHEESNKMEHFDLTSDEYISHMLKNAPILDPADDPNSSINPDLEPGWWPLQLYSIDCHKTFSPFFVKSDNLWNLCHFFSQTTFHSKKHFS